MNDNHWLPDMNQNPPFPGPDTADPNTIFYGSNMVTNLAGPIRPHQSIHTAHSMNPPQFSGVNYPPLTMSSIYPPSYHPLLTETVDNTQPFAGISVAHSAPQVSSYSVHSNFVQPEMLGTPCPGGVLALYAPERMTFIKRELKNMDEKSSLYKFYKKRLKSQQAAAEIQEKKKTRRPKRAKQIKQGREERREKKRLRAAMKRASETDEERRKRLEKQRIYDAKYRASRTEEQRKKRNEKQLI